MMDTKTGTVKFFDNRPGKKFGFIVPDKREPHGKDIFFHLNGWCRIVEEIIGDLGFEVGTIPAREPVKDDRIVYREAEHQKGPVAFEWGYASDWETAKAFIAERPWPNCPVCRVVRQDKELPYDKTVLWEGYRQLLMEVIFSCCHPDFYPGSPNWYRGVWCEEFRVGGWERMWNPLDSGLGLNPPVITPENRRKLERFELARLVCAGEKIRNEASIGLYESPGVIFGDEVRGFCVGEMVTALLGKFKDAKTACELFKKREKELPWANPDRIRANYVCGELLCLPFELIVEATTLRLEYNPQRLAERLRAGSTATLDSHDRAAVDSYRSRVVNKTR